MAQGLHAPHAPARQSTLRPSPFPTPATAPPPAQGNRITQGISCADVADVCLRALHNPEARNKTFEARRGWGRGGGQQRGRGPAASAHIAAPTHACLPPRPNTLDNHHRTAPHPPCHPQVCFEYEPEEGLELYELISHLPDKSNSYLTPALAPLAKNT